MNIRINVGEQVNNKLAWNWQNAIQFVHSLFSALSEISFKNISQTHWHAWFYDGFNRDQMRLKNSDKINVTKLVRILENYDNAFTKYVTIWEKVHERSQKPKFHRTAKIWKSVHNKAFCTFDFKIFRCFGLLSFFSQNVSENAVYFPLQCLTCHFFWLRVPTFSQIASIMLIPMSQPRIIPL